MSSIQTYQLTEEVPGKPGIKNPETGEVVTPPVDTKHGPKAGEPEVTKEEIPFEKNVSSIQT